MEAKKVDDISPEQGRNNPVYEEELKRRAWELYLGCIG